MISEFPSMRPLAWTDRDAIEGVTRQFPPYSDFSFVNLWGWNVCDAFLIAQLNGNLVVRFSDYLDGTPFLMFLGKNDVSTTARVLLEMADEYGLPSRLRLIPACMATHIDEESSLIATDDPDHADYLLSVEGVLRYEGQKYALQRNFVRRFVGRHANVTLKQLDLNCGKSRHLIDDLSERWFRKREGGVDAGDEHERRALERCITSFPDELITMGLFDHDRLIAFWIGEHAGDRTVISHFEKAEVWSYVGIVPYFRQRTAELLHARGIEYINLEQDLGIPGLRQSKRSYAPVAFLRKCSISAAPAHANTFALQPIGRLEVGV